MLKVLRRRRRRSGHPDGIRSGMPYIGEVASEQVEVQRSDVVIGYGQNCPCLACWHSGAESRLSSTACFGVFQDPIAGVFGSNRPALYARNGIVARSPNADLALRRAPAPAPMPARDNPGKASDEPTDKNQPR